MASQPQTVPIVPSGTHPQSSSTGTQIRGRGYFRGRRAQRQRTQASRAQADINVNAAPVQLDSKFLGFHSLNRGNAKVTLNQGFTEIVGSDYAATIKAVQSSRGFYGPAAQPLDWEYLTRGVTGGLCLASAVKLIQATPNSQLPQISLVHNFRHFTLHVPRSFVQILDLIGKTDYQDWVIRVQENADLIQRLLLKAIKYFKQNADFLARHVTLNPADTALFNGLDAINYTGFDDVFFATRSSVVAIKKRATAWLDHQLRQNFVVAVNNVNYSFGYPQLPSDTPTQAQVQAWLALFDNAVHPNYQNIILTGCLLLLDLRWLEHPDQQLQQLDPAFVGTPVAAFTIINLLNACGLHHVYEFLSAQHFVEIGRSCYEYYQETITIRLHSIFVMVQQGTSTLGSPAQLVLAPADLLRDRNTDGLMRRDLDNNLNHCISYVKLDVSHQVIKSAMIRLVKEVELDPDYEGHFTSSLVSIRRGFLSLDGMIYQQQRLNS